MQHMRAWRKLGTALAAALWLCVGACESGNEERKPLRTEPPVTNVKKPELPGIVGEQPGKLGQEVAFNLGKASDYFNALTAFEMKATTELDTTGGGRPPAHVWQEIVVKQAHDDDYELTLDLIVDGSREYNGRTGFEAIRTDGYFYFKTRDRPAFFRRKAKPSMVVSDLVPMDKLQGFLDFVQRGAKFLIGRDTHLGRPVRVYKIVESLPVDQFPTYGGRPLSDSDIRGEIWVDEGTGLVVKVDTYMERESLDAGQGSIKAVQHDTFELTKIGDIGPIKQPEKFYEGRDEFSPPEMKVPALIDE